MGKVDLKNTIAKATQGYTYTVGAKDSGGGIPFNVKLALDTDFKKTLLKAVGIFSIGVAGGIAVGIALKAKPKNK